MASIRETTKPNEILQCLQLGNEPDCTNLITTKWLFDHVLKAENECAEFVRRTNKCATLVGIPTTITADELQGENIDTLNTFGVNNAISCILRKANFEAAVHWMTHSTDDPSEDSLRDTELHLMQVAIQTVHKLWIRANAIDDNILHPLRPFVQLYINTTPIIVQPERRQMQIAPLILANSKRVETDTPNSRGLLMPKFQAENLAENLQLQLPIDIEVDPASVVPELPLERWYQDIGGKTEGRGLGAPIEQRIWFNSVLAYPYGLPIRDGWHQLATSLRDLRDWLYPNGWNRTIQLPIIQRGLLEVHNCFNVAWERRVWNLVSIEALPNAETKLDDPLPINVRMPPGAPQNGAMIDVSIMRKYGASSAPKFRAWIRLAYIWDANKIHLGNGRYSRIYATIPEVRRDKEGYLVDASNTLIRSENPKRKHGKLVAERGNKPQTAWYHPDAERTGNAIRNPQIDNLPIVTDSDVVKLFYDAKPCNTRTRDKRLERAKKALKEMHAAGHIYLEEDALDEKTGVRGRRIIEMKRGSSSDY